MAKYCLKKTSKRQSCAKRYKIEKKVRDHNRKVKRETKKLGHKKKKEKIITVPKSCPFKEEILVEAEKARERVKAEAEAKKGEAFEKQQEAKNAAPESFNPLNDKTVKAYASEVRKMIESADIIIQVLDARDPLGSRSNSVEQQVISSGKRLVLLLNKEIELDKHIRLIDSPGVVLLSAKDLDPVEVALRNAIRVDNLMDPIAPVIAILRRCSKQTLMLHYSIPEFNSTEQFLALVARKLGRLKKGARPDTNAAAKHVLHEWNSGKLRYYTVPPEDTSSASAPETGVSAEIVSQFSKEFDIDGLDDDLKQLVEGLPMETDGTFVPYNSSNEDEDDKDSEMVIDQEGSSVVVSSGRHKKIDKDLENAEPETLPTSMVIDGNVQLNRAIKKVLKKNKRAAKKQVKRTEKLADAMDITSI
ncbi:GNL3L/Grn1 putative GTPase [Teladorsagia circumcincta]|uniref:Guanine nucleotide-binding protein-like 3 homolog n=1 Tax=Teladorsagia circumcincta TaxID=45464 RepID=A0A2G9UYC7_TELCI|nr:GNL3L/Grn1 putative GTPase [Teladorsagia circumcincta]